MAKHIKPFEQDFNEVKMNPIYKTIILIVVYILTTCNTYAQDIIVKKDLTSIKSKVLEVSDFEIKYLNYENQSGPTYILLKSEIKMIIYQNGTIETFEEENVQNEVQNVSPIPNLKTFDELMKLNDNEKEVYLSTIGVNDIYQKFSKGQNLRKSGKKLLGTGLVLSIGGIGGIVASGFLLGYGNEIEGTLIYVVSYTAVTVGQILTIVSIPLSAVGGGLKRTAESQYYDLTLGKYYSSFQPKLNFGLTNNGIGLTLKF